MVAREGQRGRKWVLSFGAGYGLWEAEWMQTEAATSGKHCWGDPLPSKLSPGTRLSHPPHSDFSGQRTPPSLSTHAGDLHARLSGL